MPRLSYFYAKLIKKIRGSAIKKSVIDPSSKIEAGGNIVNVKMDRFSFCGYDCEIVNASIGPFTSIANDVVIGGSMHPISWISTSPVFYSGRDSVKVKIATHERESDKVTYIGADVWIGQRALVKQGVVVGHGAIIGMGSVVIHDVPPYAIVAGNPARLIRMRFDENVVAQLLASEWWLADEETLKAAGEYAKDPIEFIKRIRG